MLQLAVMVPHFADEIRLTSPPWAMQRAIFGALAPIARLLGYQPEYPYPYGDLGDESSASEGARASAASSGVRSGAVVTVLIIFFIASLLLWRRSRKRSR